MADYHISVGEPEAPPVEKEKKSKWTVIIVVLFLLVLLVIGCDVYIIFSKGPEPVPDSAPLVEDANAVDIRSGDEDRPDTPEERPDMPEDSGSVGITYIPKATIDLSDNLATFMFQNPSRSNNDMVLQIVIHDGIIAQSGKLSPGKQLNSMELVRGAASTLSPGEYDAKFVMLFYDPVSAQRSILKAEGAIKLTVVE